MAGSYYEIGALQATVVTAVPYYHDVIITILLIQNYFPNKIFLLDLFPL